MPEIFNLFAILRPTKKTLDDAQIVRRIETTDEVQDDLSVKFSGLADVWNDAEKIAFTPSYKPDTDEVFEYADFDVPDHLKMAATKGRQLDEFDQSDLDSPKVKLKAILGILKDIDTKEKTYYFQLTDKRNILHKNWLYAIVHLHNKYQPLKGHALTVTDTLTAVIKSDKTLLFRSYRDLSQVIDLSFVFKQATNDDIRELLASPKIANTDKDIEEILGKCDDVTRRRFSIVLHEGTLNNPNVSAQKIASNARQFDIDVDTKGKPPNNRIVFPTDHQKLKRFVKFLCQDYYESILTGDKCVSNSHRKVK